MTTNDTNSGTCTKFLAVWWSTHKITAVQIEKETDSSVWHNGRRCKKRTEESGYFDSFAEAKEFLVQFAEEKVRVARRMLELANSQLGNAKGIKEPE
jgi:hypothetical protein